MNIKFAKGVDQVSNRIRVIGGQTPVQIKLPFGLYSSDSDILLLVRETDAFHLRKAVEESPYLTQTLTQIATISEFKEFNKNKLKQKLNDFDLVLVDQRINLMKASKELGGAVNLFMRKKKTPWPLKVAGDKFTTLQFEESVKQAINGCTHALVSEGQEFTISIGKTESMTTKMTVKNAIQALFKFVCLVIWTINSSNEVNKHNTVVSVSLSSSKSINLPIYEAKD